MWAPQYGSFDILFCKYGRTLKNTGGYWQSAKYGQQGLFEKWTQKCTYIYLYFFGTNNINPKQLCGSLLKIKLKLLVVYSWLASSFVYKGYKYSYKYTKKLRLVWGYLDEAKVSDGLDTAETVQIEVLMNNKDFINCPPRNHAEIIATGKIRLNVKVAAFWCVFMTKKIGRAWKLVRKTLQ